jgi:Na+/proline symporter
VSGYGGQSPGWNDPHGQGQGWNDPNAHYNQTPGYGYGYGPPGVPGTPRSASGSTITALVLNCIITAMCCNVFAIPGIVTSVLAMNRSASDPASARRLTAWSWVIFAAAIIIPGTLIGVGLVVDASDGNMDDSGW